MKKIVAIITLGMVLAFSTMLAAPASADVEPMTTGSRVYFADVGPDVPRTIDLYNTSMSGYKYAQALETTRNYVDVVCPKDEHWRLIFTNPNGVTTHLGNGRCIKLAFDGLYRFKQYRAYAVEA